MGFEVENLSRRDIRRQERAEKKALKAQEEAKRMEKAEAEKQRKKEEEQKKKDEKKEKEKKPSFWKRFTKVENFADDFFGESDKM